jgi:CBS domain-containing protein
MQKGRNVITIGEVMNSRVNAIEPQTTVADAIQFLTEHHIGGAPVVSDDRTLLGMVSELELIDVVFDFAIRNEPVCKFMTTELQAVAADEPLSRAAQLFTLYGLRRLPVVESGKLVGILARRDLMNYMLRSNKSLAEPLEELFPALAQMAGSGTQPPSELLSIGDEAWDIET